MKRLAVPVGANVIPDGPALKMDAGVSTLLALSVVGSLVGPIGGVARLLGDAVYFALFGSLLVYSLQYFIHRNNLRAIPSYLLVSALSLNALYVASFLWSADRTDSLKHIVSLVSITFVLFVLTNLRWDRRTLLKISLAGSLLIFVNFVYWAGTGLGFRAAGMFTHRNSLAAISYYFLFFPLAARSLYDKRSVVRVYSYVTSAVALILIVAADSRAVFLSLILSAITYALWPTITRSPLRHVTYFAALLGGVVVVTIVYAYLEGWLIGADLVNAEVRGYTGGNLFSGRQAFWSDIIELISQRPLLGWGSGALPQNLLGQELSSHSLFLQWTLQVGFVGLGLLFAFFMSLWATFHRGRQLTLVRLSAAFFAGSMVRETFSVTLLQNQLVGIGSFAWAIFAIGIYAAVARRQATSTFLPAAS